MNLNDEISTGGVQEAQPYLVYAKYSFHKYYRNHGEQNYARRNPENKKRPFKRAEAKNRA